MELKANQNLKSTPRLSDEMPPIIPKDAEIVGINAQLIEHEVFWKYGDGSVMKTSTAPATEEELMSLTPPHEPEITNTSEEN